MTQDGHLRASFTKVIQKARYGSYINQNAVTSHYYETSTRRVSEGSPASTFETVSENDQPPLRLARLLTPNPSGPHRTPYGAKTQPVIFRSGK